MRWPSKDPDETLDYSLDWSRFLGTRTISSVAWYFYTADGVKTLVTSGQSVDGLRSGSQSNTSTIATIVLSQGDLNKEYRITCAITFGGGLIAERTTSLQIKEH